MYVEGSSHGLIKMHLPGGTDETYEILNEDSYMAVNKSYFPNIKNNFRKSSSGLPF
jgi:hypothetical protein